MSESEEDFMSDAFLAKLSAPQSSSATSASSSRSQTYQEKRRAQLAASEAKNKRNATRSYREREDEARKEAMETTLFEKAQRDKESGMGGGGGLGKAMGMMAKMGYKAGEGLGKKRSPEEANVETQENEVGKSGAEGYDQIVDGSVREGGGIGSGKRRKVEEEVTKPAPTSGHRFAPIEVSLWAGRKGIGHKPPPPPPAPPSPSSSSAFPPNIDPTEYRSRSKTVYEEKKAEGQLRSARTTCVELDDRDDRGFSILHLNPTHIPSFPPPLLHYLTSPSDPYNPDPSVSSTSTPAPPVSSFPSVSNHSQAEFLRLQMASDSLQETPSLEDAEDELGVGGGGLAGLQAQREEARRTAGIAGLEGNGDEDEEDWEVLAEEARKFIALPASERLALTLSYLRSEFRYCFYCGCDYPSTESLKKDCPGEREEDHD